MMTEEMFYAAEDMIWTNCEKDYRNWNDFSLGQKDEIVSGYKHGLTEEQVSTYARTDLTSDQMQEIRWALEDHGLTTQQAREAASHTELSAMGHNSEMWRFIATMLKAN